MRDLRAALGIHEWNAIAYGPEGALAFGLGSADLEDLRSVTLDSPTLGQASWRTLGPAALDLAIERFGAICAATPACSAAAPDVTASIAAALAALDATPALIDVDGTPEAILAGHPIRVAIDGAAFLRWLRAQVSRQRPDGAIILATLAGALEGSLDAGDLIAQQLAGDVGDCLGTLPRCDAHPAWGSVYSLVCSGPLSKVDADRLVADIAARPAYETVFARGPLEIACDVWPATGGAVTPSAIAAAGIPVLVLRGELDAYSALPEEILGAFGSSSSIHLVEVPNGASNVLGGFECVRSIRNGWVGTPDKPPGDTGCLDSIPLITLPN